MATHTHTIHTHTHTNHGHTHTHKHTPWPVLVVSWEISFSNLARNSISVAKRRCVPLSTRMKWVWLGSKNDCFDFCSPWIRYIAGHFPVTCMQRSAVTNTLHKAVHNHLPAHYIIIIIDKVLYSTILRCTQTHCALKHHPSDTFCPVHWNWLCSLGQPSHDSPKAGVLSATSPGPDIQKGLFPGVMLHADQLLHLGLTIKKVYFQSNVACWSATSVIVLHIFQTSLTSTR